MKKKRFSAEQIVAILKQAELGIPTGELEQFHKLFGSPTPLAMEKHISIQRPPTT